MRWISLPQRHDSVELVPMRRFPQSLGPILRHTILSCLGVVCVWSLTVHRGHAAESFKWSPSIEIASLAAGQHPKPLLVIDLAGEVTSDPFTSPLGRLLAATTFGDPRIIELSRRRFEVVCRQHGASTLVKRHVPTRSKSLPHLVQSDNFVFYFFTPDPPLLPFAPVFFPPPHLLNPPSLAAPLLRDPPLHPSPLPPAAPFRSSGPCFFLVPDCNWEYKFFGLTLDDGEIQIDTRDGIPPGQYDIVVVTYKMRDGSPLPLGEQGDAAKESGRAIKQVYVFKTELKSGVNKLE